MVNQIVFAMVIGLMTLNIGCQQAQRDRPLRSEQNRQKAPEPATNGNGSGSGNPQQTTSPQGANFNNKAVPADQLERQQEFDRIAYCTKYKIKECSNKVFGVESPDNVGKVNSPGSDASSPQPVVSPGTTSVPGTTTGATTTTTGVTTTPGTTENPTPGNTNVVTAEEDVMEGSEEEQQSDDVSNYPIPRPRPETDVSKYPVPKPRPETAGNTDQQPPVEEEAVAAPEQTAVDEASKQLVEARIAAQELRLDKAFRSSVKLAGEHVSVVFGCFESEGKAILKGSLGVSLGGGKNSLVALGENVKNDKGQDVKPILSMNCPKPETSEKALTNEERAQIASKTNSVQIAVGSNPVALTVKTGLAKDMGREGNREWVHAKISFQCFKGEAAAAKGLGQGIGLVAGQTLIVAIQASGEKEQTGAHYARVQCGNFGKGPRM